MEFVVSVPELRHVSQDAAAVPQDRERITKIQGLLNQRMTFLQDELSIITGAYDYTPVPTLSGPRPKDRRESFGDM